jgi:hypothetical protein
VKDPTINRRKYPRVHTESLVSIARLDERDALAHALDLSVGGVRFQCVGLEVKVGEIVRVSLTLGEETTTIIGQLTRVDELDEFTQEVAVSFTKMDPETRERLERYLPGGRDAEVDAENAERRAYRRIGYDMVVGISRATLIDVAAQARDLSLGGIRFVVEGLDLQLADTLRVALDLDGRSISVVGQLVRVTEIDDHSQDVALAFYQVDPQALHILERTLPFGEEVG